VIDPRTTDIVGTRVRIVKRGEAATVYARGVVRVVDYNHDTFTLLIEATEEVDSYWRLSKGSLFQVSVLDEWTETLVDDSEAATS
jgi:hypothetical protein